MSDTTDRIVAIKAVADRVQPDDAPTLTIGQVELEVDRAKIATHWQANTLYSNGTIVLPTEGNDYSYQCIQRGTSQATAHAYEDWPTRKGSTYSEGSSSPVLIWENVGTDKFNPGIAEAERNVYDINRAINACLAIKESKSAQLVDDGDVSFSQIHQHIKAMRKQYRPFSRPIELVRA